MILGGALVCALRCWGAPHSKAGDVCKRSQGRPALWQAGQLLLQGAWGAAQHIHR